MYYADPHHHCHKELRVRFSLQDVRKSVQRRGGEYAVSLHFLRPGELHAEIERLIAYHEKCLGQSQAHFSLDDARACVGEYRLAHCLIATLSHWYTWQTPEWTDVVLAMDDVDHAALLSSSPTQLRLELYSYVNTHHRGFLAATQRTEALQSFAARYSLQVAQLEYLLTLDSENEAVLVRTSTQAPAPQEIATLYNQWAFEAALFNASHVSFVIDCNAFARTIPDLIERNKQQTPSNIERPQIYTPMGVGAVIKRLTYMARQLGVYYDLEYVTPQGQKDSSSLLTLSLYGPQEVTGAPQQYGLRLARLCRMLLAYGVSKDKSGSERSKKKVTLSGAVVEAEARVHFLQRAYRFAMDAQLLQLLPPATSEQNIGRNQGSNDAALLFDSSIEQLFAEAFIASAQSQGVDGWQLEREPEPLLTAQGIFIPDFALTRDQRRVYVEILGFWTPAYRERKIQKLQLLRSRADLLLIIPVEAKEAFASIANDFPLVFYEKQIAITDVLQTLRSQYDDFSQRLEQLNLHAICQKIHEAGLVMEQDCYPLLHCHRRAEIQHVADRIASLDRDIAFVPGLGLYDTLWLSHVYTTCQQWLAQLQEGQTATLDDIIQQLKHTWPSLLACEDSTIEILLRLWPEIIIKRDSIFTATVELAQTKINQPTIAPIVETGEEISLAAPAKATKKVVREKRAATTAPKKRSIPEPETVQGNLWES
jgi:predicted nuclease of restriction endonuclease-like RecB superfamily